MESYPINFKSFQRKLFKWEPCNLRNSIQILLIVWLVYPIHTNSLDNLVLSAELIMWISHRKEIRKFENSRKFSTLDDISRATILLFFSSKYFYSWQTLKFSCISSFFKQKGNNHTLSQSSQVSGMAHAMTCKFNKLKYLGRKPRHP